MKRLDINKIQVTSPCTTDWQGMTGDDKTRFCDACNKRVYNLSAMTRCEVEAVVRETNGRFCARVMRDADGSIITATENAGLNLIRLRASKFASAIISAALSLSPLITITANANPAQHVQSEKESKHDLSVATAQDGISKIYGTVYDITGAVIVQATVTLTNEETYEKFQATSSEEGVFQVTSLPLGKYELIVTSPGFVTYKKSAIELQADQQIRFDVTLQVGTSGGCELCGYDVTLDTTSIPEILLHPIKAIQLFINKPNKEDPAKKKKNQKQ